MLVERLNKNSGNKLIEAIDLFCVNFPTSSQVDKMYLNPLVYADKILALTQKKEVLGALKIGYNSCRDVICVDFLAIEQNNRRKGLGKLLLSEFENIARMGSNKKVGLSARSSFEVINFYIGQGYFLVPEYSPCWMEKML
jgi:GNAT superfamily N-acetyltransferase